MATPNINPFNRYIGNGAATQFSVGFPYIKKEFVHVYIRRIDGAQEEMTAPDWEWVNDTEIRFPAVGSSETVLATGEILVVQRETPTESDYLFTNQKRLFPEDVMDADDLEMHILQEQKYELDRSIKVSQTSDVDPDTIIPKVEAIYDNLGIIETVGADLPNINTVANHATDISTVAGIASEVSSLSAIASDISAVANNATNIDAVVDNESNINTCATNMSSIIDAPNQASAAAASAQQAAISAAGTHFKLFQHNWFDYQVNDLSWLCADTFSWQDGTVYSNAYDHLVNDFSNLVGTTYYAWNDGDTGDSDANPVYTLSSTPSVGDDVYGSVGGGAIEVVGTVGTYASDAITVSSGNYNFPYSMNRDSSSDFTEPNTETIGSYTITYYLAQDGHKIILPDQETTATNIYNESGIAWYYVLDTTNTRFKLPRTKYGFVGLRDTVGKYVEAGLPNITGESQAQDGYIRNSHNASGAIGPYVAVGGSSRSGDGGQSAAYFNFDASLSNSIYGNSNTVQPPSTQQHLYFYVGQFSQSATEQTAGLNAELFNGKVDLDAENLSTVGKSLISSFGMPSGNYIDLTLGASGTQYTAPANGYYFFSKTIGTANKYICLTNTTSNIAITSNSNVTSHICRIYIPCKKGDVVNATYDATGVTEFFRFIYSEGEV